MRSGAISLDNPAICAPFNWDIDQFWQNPHLKLHPGAAME
jgi:hypothetical protein